MGFVLYCLASPSLSCLSGPDSDPQKIVAAATYWHANTVRLQLAWEHLLDGPGGAVDSAYLADIDSEISLARSYHMVVILTLQTERYGGSVMPDSNAIRFWQVIAGRYGSNPYVMFDLFNEPRLDAGEDTDWAIWRNGGSYGSAQYVGLQELLDVVRSTGAQNVVVAEGVGKDHDLSELPTHLLVGSNVVYGDEPSLRSRGNVADATPGQWYDNWGRLASSYPIFMEAFIDYPGSDACNPQSPTLLPQLLAYLGANHLGLIYYTLDPGIGIVGSNLEQPTAFSGNSFDCSASLAGNVYGAGQDILNWFRSQSQAAG